MDASPPSPAPSPPQNQTIKLKLKLDLAKALEEKKRRLDRTRLRRYRPYAKQRDFHAAGADHEERLLMAANQVGKTFCGAAEAAIHLTGRYPDWWQGRRWDHPVRAWAGSKTGQVTRDGVQRILVGDPAQPASWGEGLIPGDDLVDWGRGRGVENALDFIVVRHAAGGQSVLNFKTYDQGRQKWQAETLDFVWFDEEPPLDIYVEGKTRTNATAGMCFLTFTPLLGMSDVVAGFLNADGFWEG